MAWSVEVLDERVQKELDGLPNDMRARFVRISELLQSEGPQNVREPHVKPLTGKLWEMRLTGRAGIARAIYVTIVGQRIIVLRVFVKKTQKTPQSELEIALQRAKELKP